MDSTTNQPAAESARGGGSAPCPTQGDWRHFRHALNIGVDGKWAPGMGDTYYIATVSEVLAFRIEHEANARLMAAAPKLVAALRSLLAAKEPAYSGRTTEQQAARTEAQKLLDDLWTH